MLFADIVLHISILFGGVHTSPSMLHQFCLHAARSHCSGYFHSVLAVLRFAKRTEDIIFSAATSETCFVKEGYLPPRLRGNHRQPHERITLAIQNMTTELEFLTYQSMCPVGRGIVMAMYEEKEYEVGRADDGFVGIDVAHEQASGLCIGSPGPLRRTRVAITMRT